MALTFNEKYNFVHYEPSFKDTAGKYKREHMHKEAL